MSTSIYPSGYDAFIDPPEPSAPGIPGTVLAVDHIDSHIQLIDAVKALQTHVGSDGETDPASIEQRLTAARGIADSAADASAAAASDAISAMDAAALSSSALADHAADTGAHDIASTLAAAIAAHASALDPHGMYALEADLGSAAILDAGTAVGDLVQVQTGGKLPALDGSDLINLPGGGGGGGDLTQAAADMLYAPIAKGVTNGDAHDHIGGDGTQIAYASLSGLPTLGTAAAAATGDFEAAGAVSTHNALAAAHGISAWGATLVDDADANTARSTLGLGTAATTASTAYEVAGAVGAHAGGTGVHTIGGVTGLQGALDAKAPTASPTFTGTVSGITKSMVGLGSVDNTSDAGKPVSTAQQTALNLKANLESPTFTGTVSGITAAMVGAPSGSGTSTGTNTGDAATPAETTTSIGTLINGATSKTTPVDGDRLALWNSVSGLLEYLSWGNLKTTLSSVFVLLSGKSGGQKVIGGTGTTDSLDLQSTSGVGATGSQVRVLVGNNGGTQAVTVLNNGNVGIGTTTPGGPLEVVGAGFPVINGVRTTFATAGLGAAIGLLRKTVGNMQDTFGGGFVVSIGDDTVASAYIGGYYASRDGADDKGKLEFLVNPGNGVTGALETKMVVDNLGNVGIGTTSPSARLHAISTTEQLRLGFNAANYWNGLTDSAGITTYTMVGTSPAAIWTASDATTNAIYDLFTLSKNSSGTGASGIGVRLIFAAKSSTTNNTRQASIASKALVATHASRTNQITVNVSDYAASREGFRCEADGTQVKTSVNGVSAVARAAALTAEIPGDATRDELRLTELYNACKAFGIIN
jgi:hypothetical protein